MPETVAQRLEREIGEAWGALSHRHQGLPAPIQRAIQDLDIWLHGEEIQYVQLDHRVPDDSFGFVEDAIELSIFVLTEQFAVLVILPRPERGYIQAHQRHQVPRESLRDLTSTLPPLNGLFEGLTFELTYDGFPRSITVKPSDSTSSRPVLEDEQAFFVELRDDLFADD